MLQYSRLCTSLPSFLPRPLLVSFVVYLIDEAINRSDESRSTQESNWSKATYAYAKGVSLLESGEDEDLAAENLELVPSLLQRIVGKSIPLEVSLSSFSFPFTPPTYYVYSTSRRGRKKRVLIYSEL